MHGGKPVWVDEAAQPAGKQGGRGMFSQGAAHTATSPTPTTASWLTDNTFSSFLPLLTVQVGMTNPPGEPSTLLGNRRMKKRLDPKAKASTGCISTDTRP